MLKIILSDEQKQDWKALREALATLQELYEKIPKPDYDKKYGILLMEESDWANHVDKVTNKKMDLSIKLPELDESDIEVVQQFNLSMDRTQLRRDIISKEKIRAIKSLSKWKTLYFNVKMLQDQMENFWLTVPEIKNLKSSELRTSEITPRVARVIELKGQIEVYFKEGKHKDHGEALSFETALTEELWNLDSKRDIIKKKLDLFSRKRD